MATWTSAFGRLESLKHLDLYHLLGTRPQATLDEIRQAFEKRVKKWRRLSNMNSEDAQLLHNAFAVLSDDAARTEYDAILMGRRAMNNNNDDRSAIKGKKRKMEEKAPGGVESKKCKREDRFGQPYGPFRIIASKVTGRVKWFSPRLCYGFIQRLDNMQDVFFHKRAVLFYNSLWKGDIVEFDVVASGRRHNEARAVKYGFSIPSHGWS